MTYWPFWVSGFSLAFVVMAHWFLLGGALGVSGKFSAIVNRVRYGESPREAAISEDELLRALTQATLDEFPDAEGMTLQQKEGPVPGPKLPTTALQSLGSQVLFLMGILGGGLLAGLSSGRLSLDFGLASESLSRLSGGSASVSFVLLFFGGALVGAGTRMSGGCTSGHGLCGVSRVDKSSLLATASFFGAGILGSLVLGGLL